MQAARILGSIVQNELYIFLEFGICSDFRMFGVIFW